MARINSTAELEELRKDILSKRDPDKPSITLCSGTACHATGSEKVANAIEQELEQQGLKGKVDFRRTGCHGFCEKGPIVVIYPGEICYLQVTPEDISEITSQTLKENKVIDRLL
ncbi:MAG: (2Fe-2S) ferredoxin domain-containing protein, partial [Dehalococcoidales bacterium]